MRGAFLAELLKLRKWPTARLLALLSVVLTLFFRSLIPYVQYLRRQSGGSFSDTPPEEMLARLLPGGMLDTAMASFRLEGAAIALILGALLAGGEYGWGTLKTALTQRPTRMALYAGRTLAFALMLGVGVLAVLGASAVASLAIAAVEDGAVRSPSPSSVLAVAGAGWLVLGMWASLGAALATLTRSEGLAVGLGLGWMFAVEGTIGKALARLSGDVASVVGALPGAQASSLAASLGRADGAAVGAGGQAAWALLAYVAAFLALGALLLRRRDVA